MPPLEVADRYQTATLWPRVGTDDYGRSIVDRNNPVRLQVRWTTGRRELLEPDGSTIVVDAVAVVDRQIQIGSNLWLGDPLDWPGTGSAADDSELMQVKTFDSVPDIKGRSVRRTVGLMRLHDALPGG